MLDCRIETEDLVTKELGCTPVGELGLPSEIVEVLERNGVKDFDHLCVRSLGELKGWGLEGSQLGTIQTRIRELTA